MKRFILGIVMAAGLMVMATPAKVHAQEVQLRVCDLNMICDVHDPPNEWYTQGGGQLSTLCEYAVDESTIEILDGQNVSCGVWVGDHWTNELTIEILDGQGRLLARLVFKVWTPAVRVAYGVEPRRWVVDRAA